jgi:hypothetical protein
MPNLQMHAIPMEVINHWANISMKVDANIFGMICSSYQCVNQVSTKADAIYFLNLILILCKIVKIKYKYMLGFDDYMYKLCPLKMMDI